MNKAIKPEKAVGIIFGTCWPTHLASRAYAFYLIIYYIKNKVEECFTKNILLTNYIPLFIKVKCWKADRINFKLKSKFLDLLLRILPIRILMIWEIAKKENILISYQKKTSFTISSSTSTTKKL